MHMCVCVCVLNVYVHIHMHMGEIRTGKKNHLLNVFYRLDAVYIDSSFNPQHNSAGKLSLSHLTINEWLAGQEPWPDKVTEALTY